MRGYNPGFVHPDPEHSPQGRRRVALNLVPPQLPEGVLLPGGGRVGPLGGGGIPSSPLDAIVAIQFLPLMAIVAVISTFAWRRTGSALPGALVCALFVTWYITAGTATHWAPGMPLWPAR